MTKKLDKTTSPAGTKITANSVKTKDVDKLLTAANTIDLHDVVAVMAMKILEDEEQRKNGGQQRLPIDEDPDGHHDDER
jgi:hypothetical protein